MLKIKTLKLQNYAGYRNAFFDFTGDNGAFSPICLLYGVNGCGKSNALRAIHNLSMASQYLGRDSGLLFRSMTFHPDYDPTLPHFAKHNESMRIEGVFDLDGQEKTVVITSDGVEKAELPGFRNSVFIDADHPMNMNKFQIPGDRVPLFLELANAVYGFDVTVDKAVETFEASWDGTENSHADFQAGNVEGEKYIHYQDVVIDKGDSKVHFKSMSAGEKKIATLLRNLCDPMVIDCSDTVLVDNIDLHIYWERHSKLVDKITSLLPNKQIICTAHSGVLLKHVLAKYGKECLFDVEFLKGNKSSPSYTYW